VILISEYLAYGVSDRKRQLVAREMQALSEWYEAASYELGCAFSDRIVRSARAAVEHDVRNRIVHVKERGIQL
jgi:hypothetical protein